MYGSDACSRNGKLVELRRELDAVEVEHDARRIAQLCSWCGIGAGPSRMTRVYSCAGHSRADATRAAAAHASDGSDERRRGQRRASGRRRRSSENRISVRARGDDRAQASLTGLACARAREIAPAAVDRARIARASSARSAARKLRPDALRPFDQADAVVAEALGEPRRFPFIWIGEPIKIKVIKV